ncbi:MAG: allophanate hydrolase, partial [Comamonas sp.]
TGAAGPLTVTSANGTQWQASRNTALALNDGDTLQLGEPTTGLRSYVAVRGGWLAEQALGSSSTDTLARIGPKALATGQQLGIGSAHNAVAV